MENAADKSRDESRGLLERLGVPVGAIVLDSALVIGMIYGFGQMTERLESLYEWRQAVEQTEIAPRLRALEVRDIAAEKELDVLKQDIVQRLDRIERKVDGAHK